MASPLWVASNVWIPRNSTQNSKLSHGPLLSNLVENLAQKRTESEWRPFPFFWSSPKSGQKDWIWEKTFFVIFIFLFIIFQIRFLLYLLFQISGYAPGPPFENPACATRTASATRGQQPISLGQYPARDLKHPSKIPYVTTGSRWLRNQILLWNYPNIWRNLFLFLRALNYKSAINNLKTWWIPFLFLFFQMIPKTCKFYSNGVKIAIFCEKLQTSHKMTPWPRAAAAQYHRYGGAVPPLTTACVPPHFGLPKLLFLEHHVTAR